MLTINSEPRPRWGSRAARSAQSALRKNFNTFRTFTLLESPTVKQRDTFKRKMNSAMQDASSIGDQQLAEMAVRQVYVYNMIGILHSQVNTVVKPPKNPSKKQKKEPVAELNEADLMI